MRFFNLNKFIFFIFLFFFGFKICIYFFSQEIKHISFNCPIESSCQLNESLKSSLNNFKLPIESEELLKMIEMRFPIFSLISVSMKNRSNTHIELKLEEPILKFNNDFIITKNCKIVSNLFFKENAIQDLINIHSSLNFLKPSFSINAKNFLSNNQWLTKNDIINWNIDNSIEIYCKNSPWFILKLSHDISINEFIFLNCEKIKDELFLKHYKKKRINYFICDLRFKDQIIVSKKEGEFYEDKCIC